MKIRSVLCPTDFSPFSARALEHAIVLARAYEAELAVLHVYPFVMAMAGDVPYFPSGVPLDAGKRARLLAELETVTERARAGGLKPPLLLREGDPSEEILRHVRTMGVDLVVMGTHGHRGLDRWILGSVTRRVEQQAQCAVFTVPPPREGAPAAATPSYEHILCPVDLGSSEETLAAALAIARASKARLTLMYVLEGLPQLESSVLMAGIDWKEFRENLEKTARRSLREAVARQRTDGVVLDEMVASGKPYHEILAAADAEGVDLIVMGIHGQNVVERMFFGSTALHVVQQARCPVLTVRPSVDKAKP